MKNLNELFYEENKGKRFGKMVVTGYENKLVELTCDCGKVLHKQVRTIQNKLDHQRCPINPTTTWLANNTKRVFGYITILGYNTKDNVNVSCVCGKKYTLTLSAMIHKPPYSCGCMNGVVLKTAMLAKYGVEHPSQAQEVKDKKKASSLKRYGVENVAQAQEVQDKMKATRIERHGVEHALQSEELKGKKKDTMLERYGVEHAMQSKEIRDRTKATNMERYGVEYCIQNEEIKDKVRATQIERGHIITVDGQTISELLATSRRSPASMRTIANAGGSIEDITSGTYTSIEIPVRDV
ncbi:MAG: hypothetical protein Q9M19_05630, partial [Mariprofundaceae bacterium]|nr:hypothetical protein [Mariprofundaceae bacterium]